MNFLTQRPEDDDPLIPPPIDLAPNPTGPQVLKVDSDDAGSGGGSSSPAMVSPQGVALPQEVHTVSHQGPHTTQTVATPEGAAQYEKAKAAQQAEIDAHETQHKLEAPLRDATAITADQQQVLAQKAELQKRLAASEFNSQLGKLTEVEDRRRKDLEANTKVTGFWEDQSVPAKIAAALMIGLNQYAQSGRGMGGGNKAYEIFQNAEAADRQKKLDTYTRSKEFLELAQTDKVKARAAYEAKVKDIDVLQMAAANSLEKNLATLTAKSKVAGADAAFKEWKAGKDEAYAEKNQAVQQHLATQVNSGQTNTTDTVNVNKPDPNNKAPTLPEREKGEQFRQQAEAMEGLRDLAKRNPRSFKRFSDAVNDQMGADALDEGWLMKDLGGALKWTGVMKKNIAERLQDDPIALQMFQRAGVLNTAKAREVDPVGVLNKWSTDQGALASGSASGDPKAYAKTADEYAKKARRMSEATNPKAAAAERSAIQPKASLEEDVHAMRRFLGSEEAKKHPEAAAKARQTLLRLGEQNGRK